MIKRPSSSASRESWFPLSFAIYAVGSLILIGGLIYGANLLEVPSQWIAVGAIVALGAAILTGAKVTRQKDAAS